MKKNHVWVIEVYLIGSGIFIPSTINDRHFWTRKKARTAVKLVCKKSDLKYRVKKYVSE
jgi:hypothetical protein